MIAKEDMTTLRPPINLPKLTLLRGSPTDCHVLAQLFGELDDSLAVRDLEEPLRDAALCIFYPSDFSRDLLLSSERKAILPFTRITLDEWLVSQRLNVHRELAPDFLAHCTLRNLLEDLTWATRAVVWNQAYSVEEVALTSHFGASACAAIEINLTHTHFPPLVNTARLSGVTTADWYDVLVDHFGIVEPEHA